MEGTNGESPRPAEALAAEALAAEALAADALTADALAVNALTADALTADAFRDEPVGNGIPPADLAGGERAALRQHAPLLARIRMALRRWIQEGVLAPEQPLDERELARRLGVSRTPVREAILLLAGEGLVTPRPDGGYRAAPLTLEDARDLFRLLGELESRALFRAAPYGALGLARLEELDAARMTAATPSGRLAMDRRWHHHLLPAHRIGGVFREELNRLETRLARYQLALLGVEDRELLVAPVLEHRAIVDDLLADRVCRAAARLERHWLGGAEAAASLWGPEGSGGPEASPVAASSALQGRGPIPATGVDGARRIGYGMPLA